MKLAGVIGYPIGHSLSPRLHGHWLRHSGIDGAYIPLSVPPERFSYVVEALRHARFAGLNVTVPHKQAALALADVVDEAARRSSAANLLVFHENSIEARNTDVQGLCASLDEAFGSSAFRGKTVVLLGAGGAARAAILALDQMGVNELRIFNRNPERARSLAADIQGHVRMPLVPLPWSQLAQSQEVAGLLINASSGGMQDCAPLELSLGSLPKEAAVYDLVYNPPETALLREARKRGHQTANGLSMLIAQAVPAFEAFYDATPRVTAELRTELERVLAA